MILPKKRSEPNAKPYNITCINQDYLGKPKVIFTVPRNIWKGAQPHPGQANENSLLNNDIIYE